MKLREVQFRDKVSTGMPGDYSSRFAEGMGWQLELEAGIITAKRNDVVRLVPLSNVAYCEPAVEVAVEPRPVAKTKAA